MPIPRALAQTETSRLGGRAENRQELQEELTVSLPPKLREEIRSLGLTTLFFAAWFGLLMILKSLVLSEYNIEFRNVSMALVGALIVAKVVLVLEKVPLERWIPDRAALIHLILRTVLYGLGILLVLLIEKAFEIRHESGGFLPALGQVIHHEDAPHVLAATIGVAAGLLFFNAILVVRRHLGEAGLLELFLSPLPKQSGDGT